MRGGVPVHSIKVRVTPTCCRSCLGGLCPRTRVGPISTFQGVSRASSFPRVSQLLARVGSCHKRKVTTGLFCRNGITRTISVIIRCRGGRPSGPTRGLSRRSVRGLRVITTCLDSRCTFSVPLRQLARVTYVKAAGLGDYFGGCCSYAVARCIRRQHVDRTRCLLTCARLAIKRITRAMNCSASDQFTRLFQGDAKLLPLRCEGGTRQGWGRHRERL